VAARLERSREVPLAVRLDLERGDCDRYPDCMCIKRDGLSGPQINEGHPGRYHATINSLSGS